MENLVSERSKHLISIWSLALTAFGIAVAIVICFIGLSYTISNDITNKISPLKKEIEEITKKNDLLEVKIKNQFIYITNIKKHLIFIYSRADSPTTELWKKYLIDNKIKADQDLNIDNLIQ